jgi:hypothetical protein
MGRIGRSIVASNQPEPFPAAGDKDVEVGELDIAHRRHYRPAEGTDEVRDCELMAHDQYRAAGLSDSCRDGLGISLGLLRSGNDLPLKVQGFKQRRGRQPGAQLIGRDDGGEPGIAKRSQ